MSDGRKSTHGFDLSLALLIPATLLGRLSASKSVAVACVVKRGNAPQKLVILNIPITTSSRVVRRSGFSGCGRGQGSSLRIGPNALLSAHLERVPAPGRETVSSSLKLVRPGPLLGARLPCRYRTHGHRLAADWKTPDRGSSAIFPALNSRGARLTAFPGASAPEEPGEHRARWHSGLSQLW